MLRFREWIREEGDVPVNCASSAAVSGLGAPGSDEPGVKKKPKKANTVLRGVLSTVSVGQG
jgi:hypothetical protein